MHKKKEINMNDVCRFSRDHVVECSERTVLSCLEPVCVGEVSGDTSPIIWQKAKEESLHPWVKVDQAGRPLPPKRLSILEGLKH